MGGSFACPECGSELVLERLTPGRQVQCRWCETWVEVPYLPRAVEISRSRRGRRRPSWVPWAWAGVVFLAVLILVLGTSRLFRMRQHALVEKALADLAASADGHEKAGQYEEALAALEQAVGEAGKIESPGSDRLEALRGRRERLARQAIESKFAAALANPDPARVVADCEALRARARKDPALADLAEVVREQLDRTRLAWVESDLAEARRLADSARPNEALDLCDRMARNTDELAPDVRRPLWKRADDLVNGVVETLGVVLEPARGQFTLGTPAAYEATLYPLLGTALRQRGYVPRRSSSAWKDSWGQRAPYQVSTDVNEGYRGFYLQSPNRFSQLEVRFSLSHRGTTIWKDSPTIAQSRSDPSRMAAYQASRFAATYDRNPEFERLLYNDARETLLDRISARFRRAPDLIPVPRPDNSGVSVPRAAS